MNQMKAWSGGQRECCHLPSCVTYLFVYACPPTLFDNVTVCKDPRTRLHIPDLHGAYWSNLVNLLEGYLEGTVRGLFVSTTQSVLPLWSSDGIDFYLFHRVTEYSA